MGSLSDHFRNDFLKLPPEYQSFYHQAAKILGPKEAQERLIIDPARTFAYGTDASFYRLVPKIIVRARNEEDVSRLLKLATERALPVTFRTAGTSLSGQAISDSILILLAGGWNEAQVLDSGGRRIRLQPGVIGADANFVLARFGRKIGPDPASINSAMIGGIAANNASGMCCGTHQNSYRTVDQMKIVLSDGTPLDTGNPESRESFRKTHPEVIRELEAIRDDIRANPALESRIREKYRIKNTTGYGLNSFVDFQDPIDILVHLLIGSEGSLAFMSEITYQTVEEHAHKASALAFVKDIHAAGRATALLKSAAVSAVELMDRASLRAVEGKPGLPPVLAELSDTAACLLIETRAPDAATLSAQIAAIEKLLESVNPLYPAKFTTVKAEFEQFWNIRRGLFPAVGANRRTGTTVVIEDVAFAIEKLADACVDLQSLFIKHGYPEGIVFGHALDGNVHFVFTQAFETPEDIRRYETFMEDVCELVVKKHDGSLKGEHGTGRNMAPFVEREWGAQAYQLMRRAKKALDPKGILNPGVIINDDPRAYLKDLKIMARAHEVVDKCIECGFCEVKCPSREITLTPRQRIATRRELARLKGVADSDAPALSARLEADFQYLGDATCAACGLCATACPVSIDTGKMIKSLRAQNRTPGSQKVAQFVADHFGALTGAMKAGLGTARFAHLALGTPLMRGAGRGLHEATGAPQWNPWMPKPAKSSSFEDTNYGFERKIVYFPSCIARSMGPAAQDIEQRALHEATMSVLKKAGYDVVFPKGLPALCCGLSFESKGFPTQADQKLRALEKALLEASQNGAYPILCDTSPCLQRMKQHMDKRLAMREPAEFIYDFLLDKLKLQKTDESVALHVTCSSTKLGLTDKLKAVAEACSTKVVIPRDVGCCGWAGDKGFSNPELNQAALRKLKASVAGCSHGVSTSRSCEIGLSLHSGISYQSIMYLVDRCAVDPAREPVV